MNSSSTKKASLLSVIIPVYNAERHLRETLESMCSQSYQELEILCIDDGSTDHSAKIIQEYVQKDSRVRYIYQDNAGPGGARNHGIELAKGNYIAFQDSDDVAHPDMFQMLMEVMEEKHADVSICGFQKCREDLSDAQWEHNADVEAEVFTGDLAKAFEDSQKLRGHLWGKVYRRSVIGDIRFNDLRSGEDTYFNIEIAIRAKCMVVLPIPLYFYRQASDSLTHQAKHHYNSIEAGKTIGLHCFELFEQQSISREAMLLLVQRYGTNGILLPLLLMMENSCLSRDERKQLLNQAMDAVHTLRQKNPVSADIISRKYSLMYRLLAICRSLTILFLFCKVRNILLKVIKKRKCAIEVNYGFRAN
jgi:glycosyltransferase involved in cell wall biosynthesis